jgi:hypothetical protein
VGGKRNQFMDKKKPGQKTRWLYHFASIHIHPIQNP